MDHEIVPAMPQTQMKKLLQWHPGFVAAMRIELKEDNDNLQFIPEYQLTKKPLQIDILIIRKEQHQKLKSKIGQYFREHNIIEYKSPDDYLSVNDFYKVFGYACIYQSDTDHVEQIKAAEITITFACYHYPRKLLKRIKKRWNIIPQKLEKGIYLLSETPIKMQLLIIHKLSKEDYYWLQALRNNMQESADYEELARQYEPVKDLPDYKAVMDVIIRANKELLEGGTFMCDALRELFAEDFKAAEQKGHDEAMKSVAFYLKSIGMAVEDIVKAVNTNTEVVQTWFSKG